MTDLRDHDAWRCEHCLYWRRTAQTHLSVCNVDRPGAGLMPDKRDRCGRWRSATTAESLTSVLREALEEQE